MLADAFDFALDSAVEKEEKKSNGMRNFLSNALGLRMKIVFG